MWTYAAEVASCSGLDLELGASSYNPVNLIHVACHCSHAEGKNNSEKSDEALHASG